MASSPAALFDFSFSITASTSPTVKALWSSCAGGKSSGRCGLCCGGGGAQCCEERYRAKTSAWSSIGAKSPSSPLSRTRFGWYPPLSLFTQVHLSLEQEGWCSDSCSRAWIQPLLSLLAALLMALVSTSTLWKFRASASRRLSVMRPSVCSVIHGGVFRLSCLSMHSFAAVVSASLNLDHLLSTSSRPSVRGCEGCEGGAGCGGGGGASPVPAECSRLKASL